MPASPMVTSSPGYAIFNDLRRSMGTSSSQPMPTPTRDATALTMASPSPESRSHFSPNMDDVAASQQLMDEGARANPTLSSQKLSQVVGAHDKPASARNKHKKRKTKTTQKSPQTLTNRPGAAILDEAPTSSPFPFPATQPEAEEITRTSSGELRVLPAPSEPSHTVEVPDSQIAATHMGTPASPPRSSYVVPSTATKRKKTYKKSRQVKRDQIIQDVILGETVDELADTNIDPPSPSHATASHKRQRVEDTGTGTQDVAVEVTPVAAKRRKIGTPKSVTTVQDLIHTSSNDDDYTQQGSKTKLKRIKKPHTPVTTPKNVYDIPDDDSDLANGADEGPPSSAVNGFMRSTNRGESDDLKETPASKKRSAEKKKRKSGGDVYHWPASVRKPGQLLSETSKNEQDNGELMDDPISSDDEDSLHPPPEDPPADDRSEKKERKKRKRNEVKENKTPRKGARSGDGDAARPKYSRSNGSSINQVSSAERALNTVRNLGHPPDLRETGDFTEDEEELIRRAIKDYQQRRGLEVSELVEIIQWNQYDPRFHREPGFNRNKSEWTPQDREDMQESTEFWDEIKSIGLRRSHERVRRHIRQLYHQFKSGAWTEEDDEQLRNLQAAYPNQWKLISISMGDRSMYDCVNRWRDYLQYGDERKTSRWTKDEEALLIRAVTTVAQRDEDHRAESGRPPLDVYTNKDISWPQVAREMGNSRSRIQASVKWTQMMKRSDPPQIQIEYKPRTSTAARVDTSTPKKRGRPRKDASNKSGEQASRRRRKSQKTIEHSDGEEETEELETQIQDGPEPVAGSAAKKKHRQPKHSDDEPPGQARANNESNNSSPSKKKRGRPRKSGVTESDQPQKRRKSSIAKDESESKEADEEDAKDEPSDPHVSNENKKQGKERAEENESEEVGESEEHQTSREDVEESPEEDEDEAPAGQAKEGQEHEEEEEEQEDEAMDGEALRDKGQENEIQDEEDEAQENEAQDEVQDEAEDETSEGSDATHESRHDAAEVEVQSAVDSEVGSATPPPDEPEGSAEPGVDQMLWGDKYDLIFKLQDRRDDYQEDIDWEDVRKDQAYPWSEETLKAALEQLIQLLRDNDKEVDMDDFPGTIDDVMDWISEKHAAELEEHYSPS